jgi:hypothetical protein
MIPFVRASISTARGTIHEGDFEIDTGSNHAVQLTRPFVEVNQLMNSNQRTIPGPDAVEAGGPTAQRIGRLHGLRIGSLVMTNPIATFSQDTGGLLASAEYAGAIGGECLRRFRIVFDYSHRRMYLEPNRHVTDPDEYDMNGVGLAAEGTDFKDIQDPKRDTGLPSRRSWATRRRLDCGHRWQADG